MKQCKIFDMENGEYHGAILLDDGSAICGCCGGFFPADEKDETWHLEKVYDVWLDLSDAICGEDET